MLSVSIFILRGAHIPSLMSPQTGLEAPRWRLSGAPLDLHRSRYWLTITTIYYYHTLLSHFIDKHFIIKYQWYHIINREAAPCVGQWYRGKWPVVLPKRHPVPWSETSGHGLRRRFGQAPAVWIKRVLCGVLCGVGMTRPLGLAGGSRARLCGVPERVANRLLENRDAACACKGRG